MLTGLSVIALAASVFFGLRACNIFLLKEHRENKAWDWWFYQFWLNFAGSLLGWAALWLIIGEIDCDAAALCTMQMDGANFVLLTIAFLGVTGHLPVAMVTSVQALSDVLVKLSRSKALGGQDNN